MFSLIFLLSVAIGTSAQIFCHSCYGNSSEIGKYCSIDHLCTGKACYFNHDGLGGWEAGCTDTDDATPIIACQLRDGVKSGCTCAADFCNKFDIGVEALKKFWTTDPPFNEFNFYHPVVENNIMCMECGNVTVNGIVKQIPCTEETMCTGQHCVTKRGEHPRSFCGTSWETKNINVRCYKVPGSEEECICPEQLCNAILPPEPIGTTTTTKPTTITKTTTTTTTTTTTEASRTTKKAEGGRKKCKNNLKFSPNAQAVFMGEKLKQLINGQFGNKDLKNFNGDMDSHICNYAEGEA